MKVLQCPCGEELTAPDDDAIVELAQRHLAHAHPDRAGEYQREHILFMAFDLPDLPPEATERSPAGPPRVSPRRRQRRG